MLHFMKNFVYSPTFFKSNIINCIAVSIFFNKTLLIQYLPIKPPTLDSLKIKCLVIKQKKKNWKQIH